MKKEKDHAAAISNVFAKSFVNDENFNMEAVIERRAEVKSEGDIDDTIKVDTKLYSLEKKKAEKKENVEKKHNDKNKLDLKELKKNRKEKERAKRKKEAEDIAKGMNFEKGFVNFAQEDKEEESTDEPKLKKAKKKKNCGSN